MELKFENDSHSPSLASSDSDTDWEDRDTARAVEGDWIPEDLPAGPEYEPEMFRKFQTLRHGFRDLENIAMFSAVGLLFSCIVPYTFSLIPNIYMDRLLFLTHTALALIAAGVLTRIVLRLRAYQAQGIREIQKLFVGPTALWLPALSAPYIVLMVRNSPLSLVLYALFFLFLHMFARGVFSYVQTALNEISAAGFDPESPNTVDIIRHVILENEYRRALKSTDVMPGSVTDRLEQKLLNDFIQDTHQSPQQLEKLRSPLVRRFVDTWVGMNRFAASQVLLVNLMMVFLIWETLYHHPYLPPQSLWFMLAAGWTLSTLWAILIYRIQFSIRKLFRWTAISNLIYWILLGSLFPYWYPPLIRLIRLETSFQRPEVLLPLILYFILFSFVKIQRHWQAAKIFQEAGIELKPSILRKLLLSECIIAAHQNRFRTAEQMQKKEEDGWD